jgi:hypothetical protein
MNSYEEMVKNRREDFAKWSKDVLKIELTEWQLDFLFSRMRGTSTARLVRLIYRIVNSKPQTYLYTAGSRRHVNVMREKAVRMLKDSPDVEKIRVSSITFKNGSTLNFGVTTPNKHSDFDVIDHDFIDLNELAYELPKM